MSGNHPIASRSPSAMLAVSIPPGFRRWESAEKASSNRFWMMIENPKVARTGGRTPRPRVKFRTPRCKRKPRQNIAGTTRASESSGFNPVTRTVTSARKAARMLRSPCARLTSRITPKIIDNPVAKSA